MSITFLLNLMQMILSTTLIIKDEEPIATHVHLQELPIIKNMLH